jgi:light-harvesting complex 1 beta chain
MEKTDGSLSGLTAKEAQEFHSAFMSGFLGFISACAVAHLLIWVWKPWL